MHHLFTALSPEYRQRLESLPTALDTVAPLRTAHRRDLPMAIRDLSQMLTSERGALSDPYWAAPRLLSAYLRYFMPWNLVRLGRLLPSLELVDRDALLERPLILDLGSGPLTLPLALWLARPDLRGLPLTFLCADIAPHPLEVGRDLLQVIAGEESPWALRTLRAPMEAALKEARGDAALILAGNVLNELKPRRDEPLDYRMEELAEMAGSALAHGGRILVIEPGTRLGARYVTQFRRAAMEVGLAPLAPCPHHDQCPLLEQGGAGGWCHFTFPIQGAPAWLEDLSRRAKLEKGTASLSFVLLGEADKVAPPRDTIRIISDAFPLPGRREPARYACSERGLALLHDARQVHSGTAIEITWPEVERRDRKSGALELEWTPPGRETRNAGAADKGSRHRGEAGAAAAGSGNPGSPGSPGRKPARGKAVGRAAHLADGPDGEDDQQPAFLMEGAPQWNAPVAAGAGAGDDGDFDNYDGHDGHDGHDPSEPDGNRADGPDHGQTYGQMFANQPNQPHGGRAAQRRGVPRFGARRGRAHDGGAGANFDGGFVGETGGAGYGSRRQGGLPDDFGNRAESGDRRAGRTGRGGSTGMRKTGRGAGQPDGQQTARKERHPDGQRTQGRPQRPFGNARRQRHDADQEGRREGRADHDRQPRGPRQDGNQERGHERRPDRMDRVERGERGERGGQRHEHRARRHPDARPEAPHDRRPDNRQDRPAEPRRDARPDAPRDFGGQQRPGEGRKGKPRRHFDREGKPGGDGRAPRRADDRRTEGRRPEDRRPTDRRDGGQQRPQQARPGNQPERAGRGERSGDQRGDRRPGPQADQRTDRRPDRRDERRDDRRDDRQNGRRPNHADDRPDNAGHHHSRRRKPRRDD